MKAQISIQIRQSNAQEYRGGIAMHDITWTKLQGRGAFPWAAVYLKNRTKEVLRGLLPPHLRFIRSGKKYLTHGGTELEILRALVERDSTVVDVGAHVGAYTYALCQYVGAGGRVIAVEPIPDLAHLLRRATTHLRLPVTVVECALSSRDGEADLLIPLDNGVRRPGLATLEGHGATGLCRRVCLRRLDELCRDVRGRISFMKIDVEGHELSVLRGSINTLNRHRPNLLVEIEQRHSPVPVADTFQFLTALGYSGEFLDSDGTLRPLSCFDVNQHQMLRLRDIGTPAYVNNFIFRNSGR